VREKPVALGSRQCIQNVILLRERDPWHVGEPHWLTGPGDQV
jgi:hypothetical protein